MKKRVYIARKLPDIARDVLSKYFDVTQNSEGPLTQEEFIDIAKHFDGLLTTYNDSITKSILQKKEKLRAISNWAVGLDNIDIETAQQQNIEVFNLPDIVTQSTAELTMALLLSFAKRIPASFSYVQKGEWKIWQPNLFVGEEIRGKTLGIVGYGRIGKAVAKMANGFDLHILAHKRNPILKENLLGYVKQVDLDTLLQSSDYVSLHMPLTEDTYKMVDSTFLSKMKKEAILINMARGPVVDTDALYNVLQSNKIKGAALDVTDPEPLNDHPIKDLENVLITPHLGTATKECRHAMAKKAAENLIYGLQC